MCTQNNTQNFARSCSEIEADVHQRNDLLTHTCGVRRVRTPSSAGLTPSLVWVSIFSKLPSFRLTNGAGLSEDDFLASGSSDAGATSVRCIPRRDVSRDNRRHVLAMLCEVVSPLDFTRDRDPGWFTASEEGGVWSGTKATELRQVIMNAVAAPAAATIIVGLVVVQVRSLRGIVYYGSDNR